MLEKTKNRLILWLILGGGLLLRLYNLTGKPLWYDEADSVASAQKSLDYIFISPQTFKYKLFYFLILKGWLRIFGPWDYPARILSVIIGALSIFLIFKLASKLYNNKVGILSSFLFSISVFHICFSQQVRHFVLLVALTIISFYIFVKLLISTKHVYILLSALVNFLLLNTHPYAISIILVQFAIIFLKLVKQSISKFLLVKWIFLQTLGLILYLGLFLFPSLYYIKENIWWMPRFHFSLFPELFCTLIFGGPRFGFDDYRIPKKFFILPSFFSFLFLFCLGVACLKRKKIISQGSYRPVI
jgi:uncharacterized membrane protein